MTRTLFKCEKCEKEWDTANQDCPQQVNIAIRANWGYTYPAFSDGKSVYSRDSGTEILSVNVCRPCADVWKLKAMPKKDEKPSLAITTTTEDVLVELLERLGFTRQ